MTQKKLTGKGEQMKEKMVAITARILREKGFKAATVRTIAKEANVNIAAVRYYFGSKEELIGAALEYMMNLLHDQSWEKVIENMAAITGYTDRRDLELKCMQIFSAVEFPIILESNSKNSFITRYTDAATLERYVDILLDNASRPQEKNNEYLKEILHGAK